MAQSQPGFGREVAAGVGCLDCAAGLHSGQPATRDALARASLAGADRGPGVETGVPRTVETGYRLRAKAVPARRAGALVRFQAAAARCERTAAFPRVPLAGG